MKKLRYNDIYNILNNRIKNDKFRTLKELPQPHLFKDIQKASKRIIAAIQNKEKIYIIGDYDVDGVVSTAIMIEFFQLLKVDINYIIPNRFIHGYGLSPKILDKIIKCDLIITVDNGISAFEAANICKDRGIDLIITDHHTVGKTIPNAYAIVNPKQSECNFPFKDICGANVAWYLCAMIKKDLKLQIDMSIFFDLLAIAIVADIMPMRSLNATIVKAGIKKLALSKRASIKTIGTTIDISNIKEDDIGFKIAPLINCAGRMGDANIALDFLLSKNIYDASRNFELLLNLNEQRKIEQSNIYNDAKKQVDQNNDIIIVSNNNWNEGIVGIIASKLSEKYKKPAFVFSIKDNIAKGSARSSDIDLYKLLILCDEFLINYGGHTNAAGLSLNINNMDNFRSKINNIAKKIKKDNLIEKTNDNSSIGELDIACIDTKLNKMINSFRPFGLDNIAPSFLFKDLNILNIKKIGKNKEFTKVMLNDQANSIELLIFSDIDDISANGKISFIGTILENNFNNITTYNLLFKELI